jgi:nitronate monooxygenase
MVDRNFTDLEAAGTALPDYSRAYDANKALNAVASARANTEFAVQ